MEALLFALVGGALWVYYETQNGGAGAKGGINIQIATGGQQKPSGQQQQQKPQSGFGVGGGGSPFFGGGGGGNSGSPLTSGSASGTPLSFQNPAGGSGMSLDQWFSNYSSGEGGFQLKPQGDDNQEPFGVSVNGPQYDPQNPFDLSLNGGNDNVNDPFGLNLGLDDDSSGDWP